MSEARVCRWCRGCQNVLKEDERGSYCLLCNRGRSGRRRQECQKVDAFHCLQCGCIVSQQRADGLCYTCGRFRQQYCKERQRKSWGRPFA